MRNKTKTKLRLKTTKLFLIVFSVLFFISAFVSINVIAQPTDLKLKDATITDKDATVTGNITDVNSNRVKDNVTFHKVNDDITYKLVVKNQLSEEITILSITDNNNNKNVTYEYDKHQNEKLDAGSSFDFYVTTRYNKSVTDMSKRDQNTSTNFIIKYQIKDKGKKESTIINPNTGDNSFWSFILLIISIIGIITCILLDKKKSNKKLSKITMMVIVGLIAMPFVVKAATFTYKIKLVSNYSLYDKQVVTYTVNGKTKTIITGYGETITGLETPEEEGYTFEKWVYEDGTDFNPTKELTSDIKLIAKMNKIHYSINYNLNGGSTSQDNPTDYTVTDNITLVNPTKDYYTFTGWTGTDLSEPTKNVVIKNKTGNRSYTANYIPTNYTINYTGLTSTEKAELNNPTTYNIESTSFTLTNPQNRKDDDGDVVATFAGWKEGTTTSSTITLPNTNSMGNKTYEATWVEESPLTYTITYELNGGTTASANPIEFTKYTDTFTLVNPTKVGYVFKGWSGTDLTGDENLEVKVFKGTKKNLSFEAHYIPINYQVKFEKNSTNVLGTMSNQTFEYDTATNLNEVSYTKEGYSFNGWNTKEDGTGTNYADKASIINLTTTKDDVIPLYAQWKANSYTIKLNANAPTGSTAEGEMADVSMVYDTPKTLPLNMYSVAGYTFDSWNTKADGTGTKIENGDTVNNLATSGNTNLYAQWTANSYTIEFNNNGGQGTMSDLAMTYDVSKLLTKSTFTKEGYTFSRWNTKVDGTGDYYVDEASVKNLTTINNGTVVLYAEWTANSYTIKLDANAPTGSTAEGEMADVSMVYDTPKALPENAYTVTGYTFDSWNTKADGTGTKIDNKETVNNLVASGTTTLFAQWTANSYTIEFNNNGGQGTMSDLDMTYDISKTLTKSTFTKEGYTFNRWNTKADGTGNYYADEASVKNLTSSNNGTVVLYAQWNPNSYTIKLDANAPTGSTAEGEMADVSMVYDTPKALPENAYTVTGYTFDSWNTKADGTGTKIENKESVNNLVTSGTITLYAKWIPGTNTKYTVIHKKMNLDGSTYTTADTEEKTGTTNQEVTPNVKEYDGFTPPNTQTVTIKADGSTTVEYLYTRNKYTLTINDSEYVEIDKSGQYYYEQQVSITAIDREDYKFTGWSNGESNKTITLNITGNITITPTYEYNVYIITLNPNGGGVTPNSVKVTKGEAVGTLPTPIKQDDDFDGWYTSLDFTTKVTAQTIPNGDVTYFAKWTPHETPNLVCRKATSLHTAECPTTAACKNAGYTESGSQGTNIVTFGKIPHATLEAGNAYDCDVDGDGIYDEDNERFYYLTTKGENAVLISHTNYEGADKQKIENNYLYSEALTKLPLKTTEQWNNARVTFTNPVDSTDTNVYAARFVTYDELKAATGKTSLTAQGDLDDYTYLLENTQFVGVGRSGIWLDSTGESTYYRIHTGTNNRNVTTVAETSYNVARPVIEVPLEYMDLTDDDANTYTITFESNGGTTVNPIDIEENTPIGSLPNITKNGFEFDGWYYEPGFINKVKDTDIITEDITIYAKWNIVAEAIINDTYYNSLADAITAVPTTGEETTIKLLKDISATVTIPKTKNIILDLQNYTVSTSSTNPIIENNGTMVIKNGSMYTSSSGASAINSNSGATIKLIDLTITATGAKQAFYNNGGTAEILGDCHFSNTSNNRAAVHNLNNGNLTIKSGEIIATGYHGVYNEKGTVTIGEKEGVIDTTNPVIQGVNSGLSLATDQTFNFYDGIIKGKENAISNPSALDGKEEGSDIQNDTEEIDGQTYKTAIMYMETSKYKVTYDADGGTLSQSYKVIDIGDAIGELPTPTKGVYTFDGWFSQKTGGVEITSSYIPESNIKIYARYHYAGTDEVVTFNMTSDPMKVYYNNLNTWLSDTSTFQTNMNDNFYNYNCSECTGPYYQACPAPQANKTLCEQSLGYSIGINSINVYESNETTKVKGALVTYTTVKDGAIYNMIPGQTYYWESHDDANVHGYVKAEGKRRTISSNVRNVRDLGGLEVDTNNDGTIDGTIKYGKLFRGAKLSTNSRDVAQLQKLGITEEVDLRGSSEEATFSNYQARNIINYLIYPDTYPDNYSEFRQALVDTMQDVINGENIYFHCAIGTDRTGTMAYFLEGLLGVGEEDKLEDFELSYFTGLLNRHRFHDNISSSTINPRFNTMYNTYKTNQSIYEYFMSGSTNTTSDTQLINNFRTAMIDYN